MERCVKCGYPATTLMTYEYGERVMAVRPIDTAVRPQGAIGLCAGHAMTRTAPVGWRLIDELSSEMPLFVIGDNRDGP